MADRFWLKRRRASIVPTQQLPPDSTVARATVAFSYPSDAVASLALAGRKLRPPTSPPALSYLIGNIIFVSPKEKMSWVHTYWVVAVVQYVQSFIKGAVTNLIAHPMGSSALAVNPETTISLISSAANPFPTFLWPFSVNLTPKAINIRSVHRNSIAYTGRVF